jgi:prophage regulatory protein
MDVSNPILRQNQVLQLVGMKRTWLWLACKQGRFPSPVKLGSRAIGWRSGDVNAWLASRQNAI